MFKSTPRQNIRIIACEPRGQGIRQIEELVQKAAEMDASDLHLVEGTPPVLRVKGELVCIGVQSLAGEEIQGLIYQILTQGHRDTLEKNRTVDLAINISGAGRFRVNAYYQRGFITAVLRRLADEIPKLDDLGVPASMKKIIDMRAGLVLVTGATGSGKTTTLAALIDAINKTHAYNIITIEDPVEYMHFNQKSIINQRELYTDVNSFSAALRTALRADPDVILVGEMRDLETIRTAIMAAETGHLVLATLHSRDATSSISRMIGVFPSAEQMQIRQQLSVSLKYVLSQQLLPQADGKGRVLAAEALVITPAIANLIRLNKQEHIYMNIETGNNVGMQTMEQCLADLVLAGRIDEKTALRAAKKESLVKARLHKN